MKGRKERNQLIIGFVFFLTFIVLGSIQIMSSPTLFVRGINLFLVITSAAVLGAFIREIFIVKEKKQADTN